MLASAHDRDFYTTGTGSIERSGGCVRLANQAHGPGTSYYTNAQFDDYRHKRRSNFNWRPPLRMTIRARFSHGPEKLHGTAGFGFWNDPFLMSGLRMPVLPRAIWFFYSSRPSNMDLVPGMQGWGWKAAVIDAARPEFMALLPFAPAAMPLMCSQFLYRRLWPIAQRAMHAHEAILPQDMTAWHVYTLDWREHDASFYVDGRLFARFPDAPRGPLGLVVWLDNQYMVVRPWGELRHGVLPIEEEQWLEVDWLHVG